MRTMYLLLSSKMLRVESAAPLLLALTMIARAETYTVTDPRPMWKLITILEQKYGWRVTYEDPPFENPDDLVDVTHPAVKAQAPEARTLIPKTATFTFRMATPPDRDPDRRDSLDRIVQAYRASGLSGGFRVLHQGGFSHVVAGEVRKRDGTISARQSILDARISFPAQDRTLGDALALVLKLAGDLTATRIVLGNVPSNLLSHHTEIGSANLAARDALILAFGSVNAEAISYGLSPIQLTWALLYQADQQTYYFNAHGVSVPLRISPFHKKRQ